MKKGKRGIAYKSGKLLCAIAIALLIASFSPFTFAPVSADVSLQSEKWSDYFVAPNLSNEVLYQDWNCSEEAEAIFKVQFVFQYLSYSICLLHVLFFHKVIYIPITQ